MSPQIENAKKLKWQQKRVRGANKNKYISENWLDK